MPEGHAIESGLLHLSTGKLCQLCSKWVPFESQRRIKSEKGEGKGLCFSYAQNMVGI